MTIHDYLELTVPLLDDNGNLTDKTIVVRTSSILSSQSINKSYEVDASGQRTLKKKERKKRLNVRKKISQVQTINPT